MNQIQDHLMQCGPFKQRPKRAVNAQGLLSSTHSSLLPWVVPYTLGAKRKPKDNTPPQQVVKTKQLFSCQCAICGQLSFANRAGNKVTPPVIANKTLCSSQTPTDKQEWPTGLTDKALQLDDRLGGHAKISPLSGYEVLTYVYMR